MRNIGILSEDIELINQFKESTIFEKVHVLTSEDVVNETLDILLVSDRSMTISALKEEANTFQKCKFFYMVSNENFTNLSRALVESDSITMIPPKLTVSQILDFVHMRIQKNATRKNKVFTFFGTDSKVGTTMIAQSTAEVLAKVSERVVFVPLDGTYGDDYCQFDSKIGLNNIKAKLQTKILSKGELEEMCVKSRTGYDVLPGIKSILTRRHFHPEQVSYLIDQLKQSYDIVIVDAGSNIDLGTSIAGLHASPNRFLVTTQQALCFKRFSQLKTQVLDLMSLGHFLMIVNKYIDHPSVIDAKRLESNYQCNLISKVPYLEYGWQCEQEEKTLLHIKDQDFNNSIDEVVQIITAHLGIPFNISPKKKKGLLSRLVSSKSKRDVNQLGPAI